MTIVSPNNMAASSPLPHVWKEEGSFVEDEDKAVSSPAAPETLHRSGLFTGEHGLNLFEVFKTKA